MASIGPEGQSALGASGPGVVGSWTFWVSLTAITVRWQTVTKISSGTFCWFWNRHGSHWRLGPARRGRYGQNPPEKGPDIPGAGSRRVGVRRRRAGSSWPQAKACLRTGLAETSCRKCYNSRPDLRLILTLLRCFDDLSAPVGSRGPEILSAEPVWRGAPSKRSRRAEPSRRAARRRTTHSRSGRMRAAVILLLTPQ